MRRKIIIFFIIAMTTISFGGFSVFAAPPQFTELPGILDMFLPPVPTPSWEDIEWIEWEPEIPEPEPTPTPVPVHIPEIVPIFPEYDLRPDPPPAPEIPPPPVHVYYPRGLRDIAGHWSEQFILNAFDNGFLHVPHDNMVRPNQQITRGEFAFSLNQWIINNYAFLQAMGFSYEGAALPVVGVPQEHRFRSSIESLAAMGMVGGEVAFAPDEYVQRQEISRIWLNLFLRLPVSTFTLEYFRGLDVENILNQYRDQDRIAGWARDSSAVMTDRRIMSGAGGMFRPTDPITRAEAMATFFNTERALRTGN